MPPPLPPVPPEMVKPSKVTSVAVFEIEKMPKLADADVLRCVYSTDAADTGRTVPVEPRNGKAVRLTVPAAGFAVYR